MICQFCGKQVDDNAVICRYCGSRLANNVKTKGVSSVDDSDMTVIMPKVKSSSSAKGFENSRAVRETERAGQTARTSRGNVKNTEKRQYYRYNPDAKHTSPRQKQVQYRNDRKAPPRYNGGMNSQPRAKKHGVGKWLLKTLGLAVIGIVLGMLLYLGTISVSNWFKSVGNRDNTPSVSVPSENKSDSKTNTKTDTDSEKKNNSQTAENKPDNAESSDTNSLSDRDSSAKASGNSSSKDKNTSSDSSKSDKNKNDVREDSSDREVESKSEGSSSKNDTSEGSAGSSSSESSGGNETSVSDDLED